MTETDLELFRKYGFQITKWGEEPFVDLQESTWSGKPFEWVRRQSSYCRRAGITVVEHRRDEMDDASWQLLMRELREVSDELLATKSHAHEVQLVEGQLEVRAGAAAACLSPTRPGLRGASKVFVIALPMQNGRQWSFEMYRHRVDAVRGVVPHLFHEAMILMKKEGVEAVSLCLIPGLGCEEAVGRQFVDAVGLTFGRRHLNFVFDFADFIISRAGFGRGMKAAVRCSRPALDPMSTLVFFIMSGMLTSARKVGQEFHREASQARPAQTASERGESS